MQNKDKINTPGTEYTNEIKPGTVVALGMFDRSDSAAIRTCSCCVYV